MDNDEIINQRHSRLLGKEHWFHKDNVKEMLNEARQSSFADAIEALRLHQSHCDECANDNIDMAIIILENMKKRL